MLQRLDCTIGDFFGMMTQRTMTRLLILFVALPVLSGCVSSGALYSANVTNVDLRAGNFEVVATDVSGSAQAEYILGFSGAFGPEVRTFALFRIEGSGLLYREAIADLWQNFASEHGSPEGRAVGLVNVRYDSDAVNVLGLYTRPQLHVRADVVEFTD